MLMDNEYIICAAIWFQDGNKHEHQPVNIETGFVVCGRRHHNCYIIVSIIRNESYKVSEYGKNIQGFLTNKNRFVDRKEAMTIALEANQVINPYAGYNLFSEDIY
jgi:hypothetical protein